VLPILIIVPTRHQGKQWIHNLLAADATLPVDASSRVTQDPHLYSANLHLGTSKVKAQMRVFVRGIALALSVVSLAACMTTGRGFPLNKQAQQLGVSTFEFVRQGTDSSPVKVTMPHGERLEGRYQVARDATLRRGFGSFCAFGTAGAVSGFSHASALSIGDGKLFPLRWSQRLRSIVC
jgi:hypothetical protein